MPRQASGSVLGKTLIAISLLLLTLMVLPSIYPIRGRCKQTSPKNACINNLRQIDGAKEQWALETKRSDGERTIDAEVNEYMKGGAPKCPAGGKYIYGPVGATPRCSIMGHTLI